MGDGNEMRSSEEVNTTTSTSSSRRRKTTSSLSMEISKYPRDLLERFNLYSSGDHLEDDEVEEGDEEEEEGDEGIELDLGLSLGGRFGVEKSSYCSGAYSFFKRKRKKLTRSSSIAGSIPLPRDEDGFSFGCVGTSAAAKVAAAVGGAGGSQHRPAALLRTSSLPVETEEEWRKRKEMQSLRRKEAKRRRSQKQLRGGGSGTSELERGNIDVKGFVNIHGAPRRDKNGALPGSGGETRSSANTQSLQDRINQEAAGPSAARTNENPTKPSAAELDNPSNRGGESTSNSAEEMPCVFTKGDGVNGRRVDGILYKYRRGEEVRIMCICHGIFHTPADFVKHAGGRDVDNPLRHIVMNPSGPSF